MLTKDAIKENEALAELPDEVLTAIVKLSNEATQSEVNGAVSRIHDQYETDWAAIVGEGKPQGVKTYEWIKQTGSEIKKAAENNRTGSLKEELETLKAERDSLKIQIEKGDGSGALKQELDLVRGKLEAAQSNLETAKKAQAEAEAAKGELELNYHFTGALSGLKFKEDVLSPEARQIIVEQAKKNVLSKYEHTYTDDGTGRRSLAFRNPETGAIYTNPETGKPYTAAELVAKQPGVADILDNGRKQSGTDSGKAASNGKTGSALTGGWTTQVEAREAIISHLSNQGIARGTQAFQDALDKAWAENEISKLPIQ